MKRDFLRVTDLGKDELHSLIDRALHMKEGGGAGACPIIGKSVGLLFEKSSTRTRVSFEVGIYQLGGQPVTMNIKDIQLGRGETVADTAQTLSRFLSAIAIRTHEHSRIEEFAGLASIPVINALTDDHHPCQALADLLTIREKKGRLKGIKTAYIGDGNNVANSLIEAAALTDMELSLACPEGYEPDETILEESRKIAGGGIDVFNDPAKAVEGADIIYTDVWVSMGQEDEADVRLKAFEGYEVNSALLSKAHKDAIVMHCLPAYRGKEISAEVIDGPQSVVFDQAENRLHAQKALLEFLLT